jgi:hypothetical protein
MGTHEAFGRRRRVSGYAEPKAIAPEVAKYPSGRTRKHECRRSLALSSSPCFLGEVFDPGSDFNAMRLEFEMAGFE